MSAYVIFDVDIWDLQKYQEFMVKVKPAIESADDALAAVDCGAEGVVVSNHGGRQLDGVPGTLDKLPEVLAAVGDRAEVYIDSGIRNGIDALIAIALGARGVMIGRAWVYALASRGEAGVYDILDLHRREMTAGMALAGVSRIEDLNADALERVQ